MLKLDEVNELLQSTEEKDSNYIHSSMNSFIDKMTTKQSSRSQSASKQQMLSMDASQNEKLVKSIAKNLSRSNSLLELTIVGINLSKSAAEYLNHGILKSPKLTKLRLNFCLFKKELVLALMPAFCSPSKVPIQDLNLAANGMTDHDCGNLFNKIITAHAEFRDQIYWKYGLRNEIPPAD